MKGYRFYADLVGTEVEQVAANGFYPDNAKRLLSPRTTVRQLRDLAKAGRHVNCVALLLGKEHQSGDTQEALVSTFGHANSDVSLGLVNRSYLRQCRRIPADLALRLHPRLAERLKPET